MASASSSRDWEKAFDGIIEAICVSCTREGLTGREEIQEIVDACRQKLTVELIQRKMSDSGSLIGQRESSEEQNDPGSTEHGQEKPAMCPPGPTPVEKLATKLKRQRQQHAMLVETMRMQQRQTEAMVQQKQRQIEQLQRQVDQGRKELAVANARTSVKNNDAAKNDEDGRFTNEEGRERGKGKKRRRRGEGQPKAKKRPLRALCQREGCTVRPQRPSELFCSQHKPRICRFEGCSLQSQVGGVCYRHGAKKRKGCSFEGCTNQAQNGGLCKRHGARVKMCTMDGCVRQVERGGYCVRHGAERGIMHYPKKRCVRVDDVEERTRGGDGETKDVQREYAQKGYTQMGYDQMGYAQTGYAQTGYAQTEYCEGGGAVEMMGQEAEEDVEEPSVGVEEESESEEEDNTFPSRF